MRVLAISPALIFLTLAVGGCGTLSEMTESKVDYKASTTLPPLEVPPDLTAPSRDSRFALPESARQSATLSGYQQQRREQARTGSSVVLPQMPELRVERAGTVRWLVVPQPPEKVWPVVREFWQERGFLISREVPEAGVMETDWAENRANLPQGGLRGLLGRFGGQIYETSLRDKYRTRLERAPDGKGTEVYISHRGMEEVYSEAATGEGGRATIWQPRESDPGLEAEFLRLLMVRMGESEERAKVAVATEPAPERAQLVKQSDGTQLLQVNEPFDRAWRRVGLALDRVGFTVEDRDRQNGLYFVRYADPEGDMRAKDAERGLLSRIFSWGDDAKVKAEQYRVQVSEQKNVSRVDVLNKDGAAENSRTVQRILGLLHEQLK